MDVVRVQTVITHSSVREGCTATAFFIPLLCASEVCTGAPCALPTVCAREACTAPTHDLICLCNEILHCHFRRTGPVCISLYSCCPYCIPFLCERSMHCCCLYCMCVVKVCDAAVRIVPAVYVRLSCSAASPPVRSKGRLYHFSQCCTCFACLSTPRVNTVTTMAF